MSCASVIDDATIRAYRETHYCVRGDTPMTLKVDEASLPLAALHRRLQVASSAFITAANPFSQGCDEQANARRQQSLSMELAQLGLSVIAGLGEHPSNGWPGEPSFLVPGLSLELAKALGRKYGQNAVIWCGADAVPRLILLR